MQEKAWVSGQNPSNRAPEKPSGTTTQRDPGLLLWCVLRILTLIYADRTRKWILGHQLPVWKRMWGKTAIQFVISEDLKGKTHHICRHFVTCMHFIVSSYNQAINNCAQMLTGPSTFLGIWRGGENKRSIRSGVAVTIVCELLGKQTSPSGPPIP